MTPPADHPEGSDVRKAVVVSTSTLSPTQFAIADAGKTLFSDSLTTGKEFCKWMVPICSGEVATYLALLKFVGVPSALAPPVSQFLLLSVLPAGLFVLAMLVFVLGVLPRRFKQATLDTPSGTEELYDEVVNSRRLVILVGTGVFLAANLLMIGILSYALVY